MPPAAPLIDFVIVTFERLSVTGPLQHWSTAVLRAPSRVVHAVSEGGGAGRALLYEHGIHGGTSKENAPITTLYYDFKPTWIDPLLLS